MREVLQERVDQQGRREQSTQRYDCHVEKFRRQSDRADKVTLLLPYFKPGYGAKVDRHRKEQSAKEHYGRDQIEYRQAPGIRKKPLQWIEQQTYAETVL
jgi:hypothetical protein